MKNVCGWWIPDGDTHFADHLHRGEQLENGRGSYQLGKIKAALHEVPKNRRRVALDIGAHCGFWSYPLAGVFETVVAFEPVQALVECWERNVELPNVSLKKCALGDKHCMANVQECVENSGNSYINEGSSGQEIEMFKLDDMYYKNVDFIKIDTEGYELPIIRGAAETILRNKPIIVVEQKPGNAERYGFQRLDALQLLCAWGSRVLWVKAGDYCVGW